MKYKGLRFVMKVKNVKKDHVLKDCPLVIDGDSYFRGSYVESGCKFILGGEFDRYADHLKKKLSVFTQGNVTCYVIFNGAMTADLKRRELLHQKLIDDKMILVPGDDNYYEPVFTKDVQKQVLDELGIKYYICENDARATMLDVSKHYSCAVLTNNFEYCLLGMSCITPSSIAFDKNKKEISCKIQTPQSLRDYFGMNDNMKPIFMAVLDEDGLLYREIHRIVGTQSKNPIGKLLYWINHQRQQEAIDKLVQFLDSDADRQAFKATESELRKLMFDSRKNHAVKYFNKTGQSTAQHQNDVNNNSITFKKGVSSGRIAIPYINLKNSGWFSGSWVVCDKNKDDAMLPAMDIVMYAYSVITNVKQSEITFIGRKSDKSCVTQVTSDVQFDAPAVGIFQEANVKTKKKKHQQQPDHFRNFVDSALPGFKWSLLNEVPEDSWLLIISLTYYTFKVGTDFITAAYSILVSYLMLGPVSEKVGLIRHSNLTMCHSQELDDINREAYKDCLKIAHAMIDYFYEDNIKQKFNRTVLHELAEFQHCLQQMNYLNKLCGETVQCTKYHKTYNGTLVFNVLLRMRTSEDLDAFLLSHFEYSPSVLHYYKRFKEIFDKCLSSVHK